MDAGDQFKGAEPLRPIFYDPLYPLKGTLSGLYGPRVIKQGQVPDE